MKYKIAFLSLAMATIVLVSMGAGVSAAKPATVSAPITGAPAVCYDGANVWYVAQGVATSGGNIYYKIGTGAWSSAIGSGTNPTVVCQGGAGEVAIFVRGMNGGLYEKTTTNGGATWSSWTAWPGTVARGSGPAATYTVGRAIVISSLPRSTSIYTTTLQTDVFIVNSTNNHLTLDSQVNFMLNSQLTSTMQQTDLGGIVTATPAAVVTGASGIDVFVRGTNGGLYEKMSSTGLGSWTKFSNGVLAAGTGPTATVDPTSGNIHVLVQGTTGHLYEAHSTDGGLTWSIWLNLGGFLTSSPSAANSTNIVATARGRDGGIWTDTGSAPYTVTSDWSWSTTSIAGPP